MKHFEKFNLGDPTERQLYVDLLNNSDVKIIKENFTWDKLKNNTPHVAVWYETQDF